MILFCELWIDLYGQFGLKWFVKVWSTFGKAPDHLLWLIGLDGSGRNFDCDYLICYQGECQRCYASKNKLWNIMKTNCEIWDSDFEILVFVLICYKSIDSKVSKVKIKSEPYK